MAVLVEIVEVSVGFMGGDRIAPKNLSCVRSGQALEARKPRHFQSKDWQLISLLEKSKGFWLVSCPWIRPHHGSE